MITLAPWRTLRGRLLVLALLVEALMLALLVGNSLRLLNDGMSTQVKSHADQLLPVLSAALVAPLAQHDHATAQAVLDESVAVRGIDYAAIVDSQGHLVAHAGWPANTPLPSADAAFRIDPQETPPRYDVVRSVSYAGQPLGVLHFGINLSGIVKARQDLLLQGILIALGELILSALLLTLIGLRMTKMSQEYDELVIAKRIAEKANQTKSQFLANMS
ncbi:MAG: hypothetical protein Q8O20_09455, partial [Sulfuricurvum sp.]|uniref:hypothetical protein n=1 Tax=Sulfuricurvum sp. TaxID=2025608 RepID=UPI002733980A